MAQVKEFNQKSIGRVMEDGDNCAQIPPEGPGHTDLTESSIHLTSSSDGGEENSDTRKVRKQISWADDLETVWEFEIERRRKMLVGERITQACHAFSSHNRWGNLNYLVGM